jgi:hypothetical protein
MAVSHPLATTLLLSGLFFRLFIGHGSHLTAPPHDFLFQANDYCKKRLEVHTLFA